MLSRRWNKEWSSCPIQRLILKRMRPRKRPSGKRQKNMVSLRQPKRKNKGCDMVSTISANWVLQIRSRRKPWEKKSSRSCSSTQKRFKPPTNRSLGSAKSCCWRLWITIIPRSMSSSTVYTGTSRILWNNCRPLTKMAPTMSAAKNRNSVRSTER